MNARRAVLATLSTWPALAALATLGTALPAAAQSGAKPVRLLLPLAPGSGLETVARLLAQAMTPALGAAPIVENKPGASGTLALDQVAKAPPDVPSLGLATGSMLGLVPHVMKRLPFDPQRDLVPVVQIGTSPFVLVVAAEHPAKTLAQFIAQAKAKPASLSFGSYGIGTAGHVVGAAFNQAAGVDLLHVPYKGATLAINDLIGGQVTAVVSDFGSAMTYLGPNGRLRALAVTGRQRNPSFPNVPTFGEQGYPALDPLVGWVGLFAPATLPPATLAMWSREAAAALRTDAVKERLAAIGYEPSGATGEAFAAIVRQEAPRWGELIRTTGVTFE